MNDFDWQNISVPLYITNVVKDFDWQIISVPLYITNSEPFWLANHFCTSVPYRQWKILTGKSFLYLCTLQAMKDFDWQIISVPLYLTGSKRFWLSNHFCTSVHYRQWKILTAKSFLYICTLQAVNDFDCQIISVPLLFTGSERFWLVDHFCICVPYRQWTILTRKSFLYLCSLQAERVWLGNHFCTSVPYRQWMIFTGKSFLYLCTLQTAKDFDWQIISVLLYLTGR